MTVSTSTAAPIVALVLSAALGGCSSEQPTEKPDHRPVLPPRATQQSCFAEAGSSTDPAATDSTPGAAPELLSESGCFEDVAQLLPGADLIPFDVASELWTDGAAKQRYMVLPPGEKVVVGADGTWAFPLGSVLIKHFSYDISGARTVETRVLLHRTTGWEGHSYEWLPDGSDARLLNEWKQVPFETSLGTVSHLFPSRSSCEACHSPSAEFVLGPTTAQMNHRVQWQGGAGNQMDALAAIEAIELPADAVTAELDQLPSPKDKSASLEGRARAYLHANCGHCHRPGGWAPPELDLDLRWQVSFADTRTCDVPLQFGTLFGKKRIAPGDPEASGLLDRVQSDGINRMPPMGTGLVDAEGVGVLRAFVTSLKACP